MAAPGQGHGERAISECFARLRAERRTGLIAFVTAGYPERDATPAIVRALVEGGADMIELGVPFSDPLAEGPVIQASSQAALQAGVTPAACLDIVNDIRHKEIAAPIVLMGYYNPLLAYGVPRFVRDAASAGVDGLIVVDLPPEEAGDLRDACAGAGLALIALAAPTSSEERLALVGRSAMGFVYCVSVRGVTGARDELPAELPEFVARVRRHTGLPVAVGFGVSRREHVQAVGRVAEAAVIGSAIVRLLAETPRGQREEKVRAYVEMVTGRQGADVRG